MNAPVVLLDRDGTIIVEREYLSDPAGVALERGTLDGLQRLSDMGSTLLVVTNQSGIGRGYFTADAADRVNQRVAELLGEKDIAISAWYVCPHTPDEACSCRKPEPGMVHRAVADFDFDPAKAYVVGDKTADINLARAVGATPVLVRTGYGARVNEDLDDVLVASDLDDASRQIAAHFNRGYQGTRS